MASVTEVLPVVGLAMVLAGLGLSRATWYRRLRATPAPVAKKPPPPDVAAGAPAKWSYFESLTEFLGFEGGSR